MEAMTKQRCTYSLRAEGSLRGPQEPQPRARQLLGGHWLPGFPALLAKVDLQIPPIPAPSQFLTSKLCHGRAWPGSRAPVKIQAWTPSSGSSTCTETLAYRRKSFPQDTSKSKSTREFPGSPVARTLQFPCQGSPRGSNPRLGNEDPTAMRHSQKMK